MKFIDINSVRGLEIDQPVFTKDVNGNYGFGKLVEEKKVKGGILRIFEVAQFSNERENTQQQDWPDDNMTYNPAYHVKNITHVCILK